MGAETRWARWREIGDVALLLMLAAAVRLWWMHAAHALSRFVDLGEATHVALAVARGDGFADAFFDGQGPTAHLLPASVAIAGGLYRLFGYPSPAANIAVALWGLVQSLIALALLYSVARSIGLRPGVARAGLLILAISPASLAQEAADFRVWEGALALCFVLANLLLLFALERRDTIPTRHLVLAAALASVTFFVNPPAGLATGTCWGLFALRILSWSRVAGFAALGALASALLIVPWTVRNERVFGQAIPLRSNFGLELALANHDTALDGEPRDATFNARIDQIHPFNSQAAEARVRAIGEVAYSQALGQKAVGWIRANPASFARLTLRHYRQFYLPEQWQLRATIWRNWTLPRMIAIWLSGLIGLVALALGVAQRRFGYAYLALYVALVGLPYAIVQPVPRYDYLVYGVLTMLAVRLIVETWETYRRSRKSIGMAR